MFKNMFNNTGKKIKIIAKVLCWIGIIGCIVSGFILPFYYGLNDFLGYAWMIDLPILIVGPLLFYILTLPLYGFGELIDKACDIEKNTRKE